MKENTEMASKHGEEVLNISGHQENIKQSYKKMPVYIQASG